MFASLSIAALAATAMALPAPQATVPKSQEFTVAFTVGGSDTFFSANAVCNGTAGSKVLVGQRLSAYPGTPAYFTGTGEKKALIFDLTDASEEPGVFGAIAQRVGDDYGFAAPITAVLGEQQYEWGSSNGTIYHKLDAGLNAFFSCERPVNGQIEYVLAFGDENSNAQPPAGCTNTKVIQNFNVPGGLTGSS